MAVDASQHVASLVGECVFGSDLQREVDAVAKNARTRDEDDNLVVIGEDGIDGH